MVGTIPSATSVPSSTRTAPTPAASPTTSSAASSAISRPSGLRSFWRRQSRYIGIWDARIAEVIKYLGSKRRLVPALAAIATGCGARTAVDLFTGTTRVAQAFKGAGATVTAVDSARYAHVFARCYIETDARDVDATAGAAGPPPVEHAPRR